MSYGIEVLFTSTLIDDFTVFAVLVAIVPVAILDFKEQMAGKEPGKCSPEFLPGSCGYE